MATLSVFHPGELHVQRTAGTRGVANELGAFLGTSVDVHSGVPALFGKLRYAWLSFLLPDEQTSHTQYISVLPVFGHPGFISLQSDTHLLIRLDAAFRKTYKHLSDILPSEANSSSRSTELLWMSFIAIDLSTRRRYRTNGIVKHFDRATNTLHVSIKEAFPNCPKYINIRTITPSTQCFSPNLVTTFTASVTLTNEDCATIRNADTFFLGTYYAARGTDINHRGGKPGFLRVTDDCCTVWWPDYRGNGMFQSIGNLHCDDRAGLTVLDFATGRLLMLFGRAEILWEAPAAEYTVESASQRIVRFRIERVRRSVGPVTALRWNMTELSPYNPDLPQHTTTGESGTTTNGEGSALFPVHVRLVKITREADDVKTFRFLSPRPVRFLPGQYATFEFGTDIDGITRMDGPIVRTWTLSEVANSTNGDVTLEVTVKRKAGGLISNWLHDSARLGLNVLLRGIDGDMTPFSKDDEDTEMDGFPTRLLLVSAGVGITPNMAILRGIGARFDHHHGSKEGKTAVVDVVMMHQDRQLTGVPFLREIDRRAGAGPAVRARVFVTTGNGDQGGDGVEERDPMMMMRHVSVKQGRMGESDLAGFVDGLTQRVVYLCGPPGFMRDVSAALVNQGVPPARIITETFDF